MVLAELFMYIYGLVQSTWSCTEVPVLYVGKAEDTLGQVPLGSEGFPKLQ